MKASTRPRHKRHRLVTGLIIIAVMLLYLYFSGEKTCNKFYTNSRCALEKEFVETWGVSDNISFFLWRYRQAILYFKYPTLNDINESQYLNALHTLTGLSEKTLKSILLLSKNNLSARSDYHRTHHNNFRNVINYLSHARSTINNNHDFLQLVIARHAALFGEATPIKKYHNTLTLLPWLRYVKATNLYYHGDFLRANTIYRRLDKTSSKWVNETSLYMRAKILLLKAQKNYPVNQSTRANVMILKKSEILFEQYLFQYPQGLYAKSAHNLKRRFMWLRRDRLTLNSAIFKNFITTYGSHDKMAMARAAHEIINLIDYSLLISGKTKLPVRAPILTAILIGNSYRMSNYKASASDLIRLQQYQKKYFQYPGLFKYIQLRLTNSIDTYKRAPTTTIHDKNNPFYTAFNKQKIIAYMKNGDHRSGQKLLLNLRDKDEVINRAHDYYISTRQYKAILTHKTILGKNFSVEKLIKYAPHTDILTIMRSNYTSNTQIYWMGKALIQYYQENNKDSKLIMQQLKQNKIFMSEQRKHTKPNGESRQ